MKVESFHYFQENTALLVKMCYFSNDRPISAEIPQPTSSHRGVDIVLIHMIASVGVSNSKHYSTRPRAKASVAET